MDEKQANILRLIQRSKADADGWYKVSKTVWPLIDGGLPADLVELRPSDDGGHLRLTERGQAVAHFFWGGL